LLIIIWYFFHNYFWPRPWLQPPETGLGLVALASASRFWPRLTSVTDKQTFCLCCLTSYLPCIIWIFQPFQPWWYMVTLRTSTTVYCDIIIVTVLQINK